MGDWQPIETAPKDGTRVLLCDADGYIACASWDSYWQWIERGSDYATEVWGAGELKPTYWQPLPAPPTGLASSTPSPLPAAPYPDEQQQPYSGPEPGQSGEQDHDR